MTIEISAFIFDMDGVITDTTEYHFLAWKRLAEEENLPFSRQDNEALLGLSRRDSLNVLLKRRDIDETTAQEWMRRKNTYFREYLPSLKVLPGVAELLDEARTVGLRLGVASSSMNAQDVLRRLDLLDSFDAIGDGYSVVNTKPAPDIFLWVAGRLNVTPNQAVVFEDSEAGVEAALKGGFWTVRVGSAGLNHAHITVSDLRNLSVIKVMELLQTTAGRGPSAQ